jgi:phytanoyl-CoA hydroxylase
VLSGLQIDNFLTNGHLVLESFWSKSQCDSLIERMQQLIERNKDTIPRVVFSTSDNSHANYDYFHDSADKINFFLEQRALDEKGKLCYPIEQAINKVGHGLHQVDTIFNKVSFDVRIKTICQQLGLARVGLLQSMYIFKQPSIGDEVNWHQDSSFLFVEDSDVIGFWFALEDATIENGCLQVIPSPNTTPLKNRMICQDGSSEIIQYRYAPWPVEQKIDLEVKQGSLVMLHGRLPHASGPNHSPRSRQAYALHVIDTTKHYPKTNWLQWRGAIPEIE